MTDIQKQVEELRIQARDLLKQADKLENDAYLEGLELKEGQWYKRKNDYIFIRDLEKFNNGIQTVYIDLDDEGIYVVLDDYHSPSLLKDCELCTECEVVAALREHNEALILKLTQFREKSNAIL